MSHSYCRISLKELLAPNEIIATNRTDHGLATLFIEGLAYDSRQVTAGTLFFALPGEKVNGTDFVEEALHRGATAIVTEEPNLLEQSLSAAIILVTNARVAMGKIASLFYGQPWEELAMFGVTGTNGKTTVTTLIGSLCQAIKGSCAIIGTIDYQLPSGRITASRTTPESIELERMLANVRDGGWKAAALECSSHASSLKRLVGIEWDLMIFTNLSQDHLDFHGSMENYFEAKSALFTNLNQQLVKKPRALINNDDRYGRRLQQKLSGMVSIMTFGQGIGATFRATQVCYHRHGTTFTLEAKGKSYLVRSPLIGTFNLYNVLAALAAVNMMGVELRRAIQILREVPQIPGRLQRVEGSTEIDIFVDYAHSPDALDNVLRTLQQLHPKRLIVLFGCGGNRDKKKRPLMGEAVARYADTIIVTSDNPRDEKPEAIIADILPGLANRNYTQIVDRQEAIEYAIHLAQPGDIILIAGKGHEQYQEIAGERLVFDDFTVAKKILRNK